MDEVITPDEIALVQKVDLHKISPVSATGFPSELLPLRTYLNWAYLPDCKTGDLKKCPVDPYGCAKGYANRQIHKTLEDAVNTQRKTPNFGVGISLLEDGLQVESERKSQTIWLWVLDLDGFVNFGGHEIDDEVRPICKRIASYEALSATTTGAHIFFLSDKPPITIPKIKFSPSKFVEYHPDIKKYRSRAIEIFSKGRFIALTGTPLFDGAPVPLRIIPSAEVDEALDWISDLAKEGGGKGYDAATLRTEDNSPKNNIGNKKYYAKLTPESLKLVLRYVDHQEEENWYHTATALARAYGQEGRPYFIDYSRGDYANRKYERFDLDEVNAKYDRVLNELPTRPDGYGIKHLIAVARAHKDWPKGSALDYEDISSKLFAWGGAGGAILSNVDVAGEQPLGYTSSTEKNNAIPSLPDNEADGGAKVPAGVDPTVADLNDQWFVSVENGKTRIFRESTNVELKVRTLEAFSPQDFKTLYANRTITSVGQNGKAQIIGLADHWLRSPQRRQYEGGLALLPGSSAPVGVYNLWRGWGVKPVAGDAKPALKHLFCVICGSNKKSYQYLIRWMARAVQRPAEPAEVAIVMRGGRGTGKGTACSWLLTIFGAHGMHILQSKHLTGNFNAHLRSACFLFADEAFFAGDKSGEAVLKGLVTEDEIVIERKGVDAFTARNRLKIIMASNSEWVIPAGFDERRFLVLDVSDSQKQDHKYFSDLKSHMDNGGLSALLHYLMNLDIINFNIRSVPATAGLDQQKILSLSPFMRWLYECLYSGTLTGDMDAWKTEVSRHSVTNNFELYVQKRRLPYVNTGRDAVGKGLKTVFTQMSEIRRRIGVGEKRERNWIVPALGEARAQFAKHLSLSTVEWPTEDDEETIP